jgi:hypothetical protein
MTKMWILNGVIATGLLFVSILFLVNKPEDFALWERWFNGGLIALNGFFFFKGLKAHVAKHSK